MTYLDANVILRYILCDNTEQAEIARELIFKGNCIATNEVIAEVIYVLNKIYEIDRKEIKKALLECMKKISVQNKAVIKNALDLYSERTLDFVDCILASQAIIDKDEIFSFDKKLNSYIKQKTSHSIQNK